MEWKLISIRATNCKPRMLIFMIWVFAVLQESICDVSSKSLKCYQLDTPGITYPEGDIIIENGTSLEIYCKLHNNFMMENNVTSEDLFFIRNNESVPPEWVKIVNGSTIKLYIENMPPTKQDMYTCNLKKINKPLCFNAVFVGTKPTNVTNFTCISYNYENLTCSWIAPDHYVKTEYNLTYYFAGRSNRGIYSCPQLTKEDNAYSCFWDISTRPHYRQSQPIYYFQLNMNNTFGEHTQKYTFYHFANVIPEPPENLTVLNKTSNSVLLSWSVKSPITNFPPGVVHRIVYQSEFDDKNVWKVANTTSIDKQNSPIFNLTGLKYAHVLYDIRVSMRSNKAQEQDERSWSRNTPLTVRTASTVPGAPPRVNIGSFEIVNNRTGRDIYVYWQSVPEDMKNGENLSYKILTYEENSIEKKIEPVDITSTYAKFVDLSLKSYKFEIVSTNEVGRSVNSSSIVIPSFKDRVPEPTSFIKISFGDQVYELSWNPPKNTGVPIKNYTIFYCRYDYDRPYQCKGYLEWIEVPYNVTMKNITVREDRVYQFAISANTENGSSGMVWASCTVIHDKELSKMKSLWIDSIGSDFIEVGWKLDCSDRIGSIEGFIIYYCPIVSPVDITCNGEERNVNISGDASRGRIKNLKPYTTYMLTVSVKSKHNTGFPSDPLYNTTLEAAPEPPEDVIVYNITSTSMIVKWSPPKAMNGVLRFYEVRYSYNNNNNGKEIKLKPANEKETFINLTNLSSFTEYNITVYAWTAFCSQPSEMTRVTTSISVPGKMHSPSIKFQNESTILVAWSPPENAGGKLDKYELRIKEKIRSENHTKIINTSELQWEVPNCGTKEYVALYFSVRAINYDDTKNKHYFGEWSTETENYCKASSKALIILIISVSSLLIVGVLFISFKRLWYRCKIMRDVEVKLPPGLAPVIASDLDMNHWPVATLQKSASNDDPLLHLRTDSSADEELLLAKKSECTESLDRIISGDSSGCSSGHESVTSSLASGTNLSSTSDSGTEQPRTPSSESASRENSLRQRRTGSETIGWDSEIAWPNTKGGYVLSIPADKPVLSPQTWTSPKITPSTNYCVLGVDNVIQQPSEIGTHSGYVPVPLSIPHNEQLKGAGNKNTSPPYVTCDSIFNKDKQSLTPVAVQPQSNQSPKKALASGYVKNDVGLVGLPVNAQQQQPTGGDKFIVEQPTDVNTSVTTSPTYVMAGGLITNEGRPYVKAPKQDNVSTATGKLINIEPLNHIDGYIQTQIEKDAPVVLSTTNLKDIVEDCINSPRQSDISASTGYVKTEDILGLKNTGEDLPYSSRRGSDDTAEQLQTQQQLQQSQQLQQPSSLNSYCRLGWDRNSGVESAPTAASPVLRKTAVESASTKGYLPHRQFENKTLKED